VRVCMYVYVCIFITKTLWKIHTKVVRDVGRQPTKH
jgi:hypothetical protein